MMKQQSWIFLIAIAFLTGCGEDDSAQIPPANTRPIEHSLGVSQVPENPQRVVTLDSSALDSAIALGMTPVGSTVFGDFPSYLSEETTEEITIVGDGNQPNLETIVNLNPDLILGTDIANRRIYKKLSRIAPTVLSEGSGRLGEWQKNFQLFAKALGKPETAQAEIAEYQEEVAQLRETLEAELGNLSAIEVSVVITGQGKIGFYSANSFSGAILEDLGFSRPLNQERFQRWATLVSREKVEQLDGDLIFLMYGSHLTEALTLEEFVNDPIFAQLEAVKEGQVYEVPTEAWTAGRSILGAEAVLNDIAEHLL
jgi:iron complex transport system substrate-binding protein